jgi:tripartite ATP-independent transporter DctM subunit
MGFFAAGLICIILLLGLMSVGLQIGLAFLLSGFITSAYLLGIDSSINLMGQAAYFSIASPTWTAIPLFILLGSFASNGELARRAYMGMHAATKGLPGSLLIATSFSCGLFGAVSGSSIATTAIFGRMALPEMLKIGYDRALSVGVIASAGTFASMIPPSMMMIIYALFTQESIGALFAAGIIPGILTIFVYSSLIIWMVKRNPSLAPVETPKPVKGITANTQTDDQNSAPEYKIWSVWPIVLIAIVVLGGLYGGFFTPTEAAAAGALSALIIGYCLGPFRNRKNLTMSLHDAAKVTSMLFLINIGALFYSRVLAVTGFPTQLTSALVDMNLPPLAFLIGVMVIMFLLGMIMVPIGIYALTLPIVMPLLRDLGYDPIWFGVVALKLTEIGAITPPVGLNVFAIKGVIPAGQNMKVEEIYKGCMPFLLADVVVLILIVAFPGIALWLPHLLE